MFKMLKKATKTDFYIIVVILLLCFLGTTLSLYLELDTYQQIGLNALISVLILAIVLSVLKKKISNQQELDTKENLLKGLLAESRQTLKVIISVAQDNQVKEPAMQLSEMIDNIRTFNTVNNGTVNRPEELLKRSRLNKQLRLGIVAILVVLMFGSLAVYVGTTLELTSSQMKHAAELSDNEAVLKLLGKGSYTFHVDENGDILDHPNSDYNTKNIKQTEYLEPYQTGSLTSITDYTDSYCVCLSKKDPATGYRTVVVTSWWTMYGSSLLLGIIIFLVFLLCIIVVDIFIDRLFDWQDSVNSQLEKAIDDAVAAGKAKSQFFAQMSHEIRTPINAVIGMNEMILRECRDAAIIKYAQNAHAASEALLSLINDILDFSKLESEKMELVEETYQLDDLIRTLINMIKFRAEKKNLDFRVNVNENIPNELFGDSTRIRQVVVNFLTNAVKYTKVGGVLFSVDMELGLDDDGTKRQQGEVLLKFSVKDSGIGIRDEDKSKLFKDFERFDAKQNKNIEGTGLGLAITAKLVKLMNGKIEVESVYGEGSTFTVLVPQKVIGRKGVGRFEERVKAEKPKTDTYRVSFVAPNARILVVDDNEMNLLVATSLLKATQIQVDTAMSGMSALKKMAEIKYDIIFLDQMMPSLDGIQTLHLAKDMKENKSPNAPMIALTANAVSGAREMFLKEGFNDYLSKPIDAVALEKMLAEYLPKNLLQEPPEESEAAVSTPTANYPPPPPAYNTPVPSSPSTAAYSLLNPALGLQYSAGMEDMYRNVLEMFCKLKDEKKAKIQEAFDKKDWNNYTTFVHALKSTSLSIGSQQTSELAKKLEESGKILIAKSTSELDKQQAEEFITNHQAEIMELYDKLVEEGRQYLGGDAALEPAAVEVKAEPIPSEPADEDDDDSDLELLLDLQNAFESEDWAKYAEAIQGISDTDNATFKQVNMACKMVTSDLTSDEEKAEAVKYIKDNHSKIMEML